MKYTESYVNNLAEKTLNNDEQVTKEFMSLARELFQINDRYYSRTIFLNKLLKLMIVLDILAGINCMIVRSWLNASFVIIILISQIVIKTVECYNFKQFNKSANLMRHTFKKVGVV